MDQMVKSLKGASVTIGITGLPVTFTGEVVTSGDAAVIGIKTPGGIKVYINPDLIAFVY